MKTFKSFRNIFRIFKPRPYSITLLVFYGSTLQSRVCRRSSREREKREPYTFPSQSSSLPRLLARRLSSSMGIKVGALSPSSASLLLLLSGVNTLFILGFDEAVGGARAKISCATQDRELLGPRDCR